MIATAPRVESAPPPETRPMITPRTNPTNEQIRAMILAAADDREARDICRDMSVAFAFGINGPRLPLSELRRLREIVRKPGEGARV